jgi:hypothetical protein
MNVNSRAVPRSHLATANRRDLKSDMTDSVRSILTARKLRMPAARSKTIRDQAALLFVGDRLLNFQQDLVWVYRALLTGVG